MLSYTKLRYNYHTNLIVPVFYSLMTIVVSLVKRFEYLLVCFADNLITSGVGQLKCVGAILCRHFVRAPKWVVEFSAAVGSPARLLEVPHQNQFSDLNVPCFSLLFSTFTALDFLCHGLTRLLYNFLVSDVICGDGGGNILEKHIWVPAKHESYWALTGGLVYRLVQQIFN